MTSAPGWATSGQRDRFERTVFTDRAAGVAAFTERRDRRFGTILRFDVEGSFSAQNWTKNGVACRGAARFGKRGVTRGLLHAPHRPRRPAKP